MDTASTHGGILKSMQDDRSENKSFAVKFNDGISGMKANKSTTILDTKSQGYNEDTITIEDIEKRIAEKVKDRGLKSKELTKTTKDGKKVLPEKE